MGFERLEEAVMRLRASRFGSMGGGWVMRRACSWRSCFMVRHFERWRRRVAGVRVSASIVCERVRRVCRGNGDDFLTIIKEFNS